MVKNKKLFYYPLDLNYLCVGKNQNKTLYHE